jgi:hypothetical protein
VCVLLGIEPRASSMLGSHSPSYIPRPSQGISALGHDGVGWEELNPTFLFLAPVWPQVKGFKVQHLVPLALGLVVQSTPRRMSPGRDSFGPKDPKSQIPRA